MIRVSTSGAEPWWTGFSSIRFVERWSGKCDPVEGDEKWRNPLRLGTAHELRGTGLAAEGLPLLHTKG